MTNLKFQKDKNIDYIYPLEQIAVRDCVRIKQDHLKK